MQSHTNENCIFWIKTLGYMKWVFGDVWVAVVTDWDCGKVLFIVQVLEVLVLSSLNRPWAEAFCLKSS